MKNSKKIIRYIFITIYGIIFLSCLILCCLNLLSYALLLIIPSIFLIPIFLTFYKIPERTNRHSGKLILLIVLRYFLDALAMAIPALVWYFIPSIKESVSAVFLLTPFFQVFLIYIIIIVLSILETKPSKKNDEK